MPSGENRKTSSPYSNHKLYPLRQSKSGLNAVLLSNLAILIHTSLGRHCLSRSLATNLSSRYLSQIKPLYQRVQDNGCRVIRVVTPSYSPVYTTYSMSVCMYISTCVLCIHYRAQELTRGNYCVHILSTLETTSRVDHLVYYTRF